jgi:hypothetical protein
MKFIHYHINSDGLLMRFFGSGRGLQRVIAEHAVSLQDAISST